MPIARRTLYLVLGAAVLLLVLDSRAEDSAWREHRSEKYGFALELPPEFALVDEDKTTTFQYQPGADGSGPLEPALMVYVNWVWMPSVPSTVLYDANKKSDLQNISSPDPDYRDLVDFDRKKGYAYAGNTYWFKEVDKPAPDEIHRWHIKSFGNKSAYTIGLTGTYGQFEKWGPVYERW